MIALGSPFLSAYAVTTVFGQSPNSPHEYLALVGATIYVSPSEDPIRNGVVLIHDARIAAVGRRGRVLPPNAEDQIVRPHDYGRVLKARALL